MTLEEAKVFQIFQQRFNKEEAKAIVTLFEKSAESKFLKRQSTLATKEDIYRLSLDNKEAANKPIMWVAGMLVAQVFALFGILKLFFS